MKTLAACLLLLLMLASWVVLIFSCFVIQTDAQGVFILIFTLPVLVLLLAISIFGAKRLSSGSASYVFLYRSSLASAVLVGAFFVFAPIPLLQVYPIVLMKAVERGSIYFFGKNPYVLVRSRTLERLIQEELRRTEEKEIYFGQLAIRGNWEKICFLPPYTDNQGARAILGFPFDVESRSIIKHSDSITAILFIQGDSVIADVDLKRGLADFAGIHPNCYSRENSVFQLVPGSSGRVFAKK